MSTKSCLTLLKSEFVDFDKVKHYAHIDIAGVFNSGLGVAGVMTGRPTRALIQFAKELAQGKLV